MKRQIILLAAGLACLLAFNRAYAIFFTIQLKNGNEVTTEKYWEDGDKIRFFTTAGTVALPKTVVKNIVRHDGDIGSDSAYFSSEFLAGVNEQDELEAVSTRAENAEAEQRQEIIADIEDRVQVIETNLVNLEKNRQTYLRQREKFNQDLEKSQQRIERYQKDTITSREYTEEYITIEQSKIADAEQKIREIDEQIKNTGDMIGKQTQMKERLERELSKLTGE